MEFRISLLFNFIHSGPSHQSLLYNDLITPSSVTKKKKYISYLKYNVDMNVSKQKNFLFPNLIYVRGGFRIVHQRLPKLLTNQVVDFMIQGVLVIHLVTEPCL